MDGYSGRQIVQAERSLRVNHETSRIVGKRTWAYFSPVTPRRDVMNDHHG
jgi:hypothetical protein